MLTSPLFAYFVRDDSTGGSVLICVVPRRLRTGRCRDASGGVAGCAKATPPACPYVGRSARCSGAVALLEFLAAAAVAGIVAADLLRRDDGLAAAFGRLVG